MHLDTTLTVTYHTAYSANGKDTFKMNIAQFKTSHIGPSTFKEIVDPESPRRLQETSADIGRDTGRRLLYLHVIDGSRQLRRLVQQEPLPQVGHDGKGKPRCRHSERFAAAREAGKRKCSIVWGFSGSSRHVWQQPQRVQQAAVARSAGAGQPLEIGNWKSEIGKVGNSLALGCDCRGSSFRRGSLNSRKIERKMVQIRYRPQTCPELFKKCLGPRGMIDKKVVKWNDGMCNECWDRFIDEAREMAEASAQAETNSSRSNSDRGRYT
ncbi:hypothetical protein F4801DRAFT_579599 [Xylaria longipes]|nr:hypothetical protein F4801DRAFT_579599 [Xylaria longipes]